jgi:hypothetical protein
MTTITLYPITGVMLGIELQKFEECNVLVIDLLILRIMIERDSK